MKNLYNKSKIIYFILGIISGIMIISSLFFMTQYRNVRVNYNIDNGEVVYLQSSTINGSDQTKLFTFINDLANRNYEQSEGGTKSQELVDNNDIFRTVLSKDETTGDYKYLTYEKIENAWNVEYKYQYSKISN